MEPGLGFRVLHRTAFANRRPLAANGLLAAGEGGGNQANWRLGFDSWGTNRCKLIDCSKIITTGGLNAPALPPARPRARVKHLTSP